MITTIIFLVVLAILVLVHELGHFLAAKKFGIRVDEFGLGFPPKIAGKKYGETEYTLNWIPFGGFVKIFGETPDAASINGPDSGRSLVSKPKWQQIIVLAAGVIFNFIFAWILVSFAFMFGVAGDKESYGEKYASRFENERIAIELVDPGSPAARGGLKPGDVIVGAKFQNNSGQAGSTFEPEINVDSIRDIINKSSGSPLTVSVRRGEETLEKQMIAERGIVADKYAIGISMAEVGTLSLPPHLAFYEGARLTYVMLKGTAVGLYDLVANAFRGEAHLSSLTGPVGIAGLVGDMARLGISYLLMLTALISINLGIINLVPFPALDGGRILFVIIEAIQRKPIAPKIANTVNAIGFLLLLALMLVITLKDVWTLWK